MSKNRLQKDSVPSKLELLMRMSRQMTMSAALLVQAEAAKNSGDLPAAEPLFQKMIAASKDHLETTLLHNEHHKHPVNIPSIVEPLLNALLMLADIVESQGRVPEAEVLRQEAADLSRLHLGRAGEAEIERSRAASLISQGRFSEALVALTTSREFFRNQGDVLQMARVSVDMADIFQWLGDYQRALSELEHAAKLIAPLVSDRRPTQQDILASLVQGVEAISSGTGDGRQAVDMAQLYRISTEINYYRGLINRYLRQFDAAEKLLQTVLPEYTTMGVGPAIEYQLAAVLVGKGKHREGLELARRLEPLFRREGFLRSKLAALLKVQAEALLSLGSEKDALDRVLEGIDDLKKYHNSDLAWQIQWLEGRILQKVGQGREALRAYGEAVETVRYLRRTPLGYRLDSTYLKDKLPMFQEAIALAVELSEPEACCKFIEMIKARTLAVVLSLASRHNGQRMNIDTLSRQFEDITRELDALEYQAYREGETEKLRRAKETLQAERTSVLERIRFSDPRWRTMTESLSFEFANVADTLRSRNQVALNLFYQHDRITAVLIADNRGWVASRDLSDNISEKLCLYRENLQSEDPDRLLYDLSASLAVGARHLIPESLLAEALQKKGLIIVPHGPLHLVPWAGLVYEGKRLFEYCPVGILPNLSCIFSLCGDFSPKPKVALIGSPTYAGLFYIKPLSHAEEELRTIEGMYSGEDRLVEPKAIGEQATEHTFWKLAQKEDVTGAILHIACHGTIEPYAPMNSGLLFNDAKVDAAEIMQSSLQYEEVVLSACSTGWRPVEVQDIELTGDDILGLPGAFLEGGVRSVLVSISPANDAAASRFMTHYHKHRKAGKMPLLSLQATQKDMLVDSEFDPYTWIGFTVYGAS